jgi:hypothetical protein
MKLKMLTFIIFCNDICFLKTGYFGNHVWQQLQRPLPACGRCAQAKTQTKDTINAPTLRSIPGDSDWYSRPYIFFILRKKYNKPYIFVNRL